VRDRHAVLLIVCLGLAHLLFFILTNTPHPIYGEDIVTISGFLRNFSESLRQSNLYPRWMGNLFAGRGAPVFVYYSPLAYYLGSLFTLPRSIDPHGVYQLGAALIAGATLSSLTAYVWLRRHAAVPAAASIAAVLLLLPSLFTSTHLDMSLAEVWATVWFPLGLCWAERWREENTRQALLGFTFILFLIVFTHVPSALLLCPALGLYACFYRRPALRTFVALGAGGALALGLAGLYWVPVLANWHFIQVSRYMRFTDDYASLFLPPYALLLFFLPQVLVDASPYLLLALIALPLSLSAAPDARLRRATLLAIVIVLACGFLFTPWSRPLWEHHFIFRLLRAPFRLLALFYGLCPLLLLAIRRRVSLAVFLLIVFLAVLPDAWVVDGEFTVRQATALEPPAMHILQRNFALQALASEYRTAWMPPGHFTLPLDAPPAVMGAGGRISVRTWENEIIQLDVHPSAATTITVRQHFFPGWVAHIDTKETAVHPDANGLMTMDLPEGAHAITLTFSALEGQRAGRLTSLVSLLMLAALWSTAPLRHSKQDAYQRQEA
jgi:hypothetical protein